MRFNWVIRARGNNRPDSITKIERYNVTEDLVILLFGFTVIDKLSAWQCNFDNKKEKDGDVKIACNIVPRRNSSLSAARG